MKHTIEQILDIMDIYGGGFVRQLAILYRLIDTIYQAIILREWNHYFSHYDADYWYNRR